MKSGAVVMAGTKMLAGSHLIIGKRSKVLRMLCTMTLQKWYEQHFEGLALKTLMIRQEHQQILRVMAVKEMKSGAVAMVTTVSGKEMKSGAVAMATTTSGKEMKDMLPYKAIPHFKAFLRGSYPF